MHRRLDNRVGRTACGVVVLLLSLAMTACGSDEKPDPAADLRDRFTSRLEETFSRDQASCIVKKMDQPSIQQLVDARELAGDSAAFRSYADAVRVCVVGPDASLPTTSAPPATSAASTTTSG